MFVLACILYKKKPIEKVLWPLTVEQKQERIKQEEERQREAIEKAKPLAVRFYDNPNEFFTGAPKNLNN